MVMKKAAGSLRAQKRGSKAVVPSRHSKRGTPERNAYENTLYFSLKCLEMFQNIYFFKKILGVVCYYADTARCSCGTSKHADE